MERIAASVDPLCRRCSSGRSAAVAAARPRRLDHRQRSPVLRDRPVAKTRRAHRRRHGRHRAGRLPRALACVRAAGAHDGGRQVQSHGRGPRAQPRRESSLAQQSIAIQEGERRALAHELHDELGQSIAAISAVAASIDGGAAARARRRSRRSARACMPSCAACCASFGPCCSTSSGSRERSRISSTGGTRATPRRFAGSTCAACDGLGDDAQHQPLPRRAGVPDEREQAFGGDRARRRARAHRGRRYAARGRRQRQGVRYGRHAAGLGLARHARAQRGARRHVQGRRASRRGRAHRDRAAGATLGVRH